MSVWREEGPQPKDNNTPAILSDSVADFVLEQTVNSSSMFHSLLAAQWGVSMSQQRPGRSALLLCDWGITPRGGGAGRACGPVWCMAGWETTVPLLGHRSTFQESTQEVLQCLPFIWMFPLASVSFLQVWLMRAGVAAAKRAARCLC